MVSAVRQARRERQVRNEKPKNVTVGNDVLSYQEWVDYRKVLGEEMELNVEENDRRTEPTE